MRPAKGQGPPAPGFVKTLIAILEQDSMPASMATRPVARWHPSLPTFVAEDRRMEASMCGRWTVGCVLVLGAMWSAQPGTQVAQTSRGATVYEGARLIVGDGS